MSDNLPTTTDTESTAQVWATRIIFAGLAVMSAPVFVKTTRELANDVGQRWDKMNTIEKGTVSFLAFSLLFPYLTVVPLMISPLYETMKKRIDER